MIVLLSVIDCFNPQTLYCCLNLLTPLEPNPVLIVNTWLIVIDQIPTVWEVVIFVKVYVYPGREILLHPSIFCAPLTLFVRVDWWGKFNVGYTEYFASVTDFLYSQIPSCYRQ